MVHFIHPERLWVFAAWGLLALWAIWSRWRRRRSWAALAQRGRPPREGALWWLATIACLIAAIAQPKWGRMGPAPAPGHDVVLMIDVSRSMGAEDAVPNRLAAAVEYAASLVDALGDGPDNRAAIVAFAGRGVCYCPLTENLGAIKEILRRLRPGCVQPGGTDLGEGLDAALEAMGTDEHAEGQSIVILSDGEDLAERWKPRLDRLLHREVVVYAVTIGDAEQGHAVPSGPGVGQPMVYRGKAVASRRNDATLREIAEQTRGLVIPLGLSSGDASLLYRKQIEPSARRRGQVPRIADMAERFPLFLVTALSCLIAACWPPGRGWPWPWRLGWFWAWGWGGVRPWAWISRSGRRRRAAALERAALVLASAGLVLAVGAAQPPQKRTGQPPEVKEPVSTPSLGTTKAARQAVSQGRAAYEKGQMEEALAAFEAAVRAAPKAAVPRYNSAAVLFQLGRFEEARAGIPRPGPSPTPPCPPRSTTRWATQGWPWATYPAPSRPTTRASPRRPGAPIWTSSARTRRSTVSSPTRRRSRRRSRRGPTIPRRRDGRTAAAPRTATRAATTPRPMGTTSRVPQPTAIIRPTRPTRRGGTAPGDAGAGRRGRRPHHAPRRLGRVAR